MVGLATFPEPAWSIRERQREFPWVVGRGEPRLFPRNPWSSWLTENPVGESRRGFRVSASNHGPFLAARPRRRVLSFVGGHEQRHGLPLMSNSNRFKLSDSLVDNPKLVNAGGAVGGPSSPHGNPCRSGRFYVKGHIPAGKRRC